METISRLLGSSLLSAWKWLLSIATLFSQHFSHRIRQCVCRAETTFISLWCYKANCYPNLHAIQQSVKWFPYMISMGLICFYPFWYNMFLFICERILIRSFVSQIYSSYAFCNRCAASEDITPYRGFYGYLLVSWSIQFKHKSVWWMKQEILFEKHW